MVFKDDILKLEIRRNIHSFINKNQGLNIREISRRLDIPKSTLIYHINYLKKLGIIKEEIEGNNKRIFIANKIGKQDKEILLLLRKKIPRRIFLYLIVSCAFSQKDICNELELSPATVNYQIKKLLKMNIIEEAKVENGRVFPFKTFKRVDYYFKRNLRGSEKIYIRKSQEIIDDVYRVLITNKSSLEDEKIIESYIRWLKYVYKIEEEIKKKGLKMSKNRPGFEKTLFFVLDFVNEEFFKPPFAY